MLLIGAGATLALVALYLFHLFYLQLIMVVWGAAVIAGSAAYDRRSKPPADRPGRVGDMEKWAKVTGDLAAIEERIAKSREESERQFFRRQKVYLEQELRRLSWSMKEASMEKTRLAQSAGALKPIPPTLSRWQRGRLRKRELAHLAECLDLASEALVSETPDAAKSEIVTIANDLRAHYDLSKSLRPESKNLADYSAAWAVLTSISRGSEPHPDLGRYASKGTKSRLGSLLSLAVSRGLVPSPAPDAPTLQEDKGIGL